MTDKKLSANRTQTGWRIIAMGGRPNKIDGFNFCHGRTKKQALRQNGNRSTRRKLY